MSDRFDAELKKGLKESTARSLQGWEFTPAMRQSVLQRIAAEEPAPAPEPAPGPAVAPAPAPLTPPASRRLAEYARPLVWVAAAAAAVTLVLRVDFDLGGVAKKSEAPAAPMAAMEAPKAESTGAPGITATQKEMAPSAKMASPGTMDVAAAGTVEQKVAARAGAPARILLVVPETGAALSAAPPAQKGPGIAAFDPSTNLALANGVTVANALLTTNQVQVFDAAGAPLWQQSLTGEGNLIDVNQSGMVAAATSQQLYLFGAGGKVTFTAKLTAAPTTLALSADGRVAVALADRVEVYQPSGLQFKRDGQPAASIAFGPDGSLAVAAARSLTLFGQDAARLAQATLNGSGQGVLFAGGGQVIIARGEAFHRSGQLIWKAPFTPQGGASLGPDGPVALWDSKQVTLLRPADGVEIWTAEQSGGELLRVAVSPDGSRLAVLGTAGSGAAVWVIDSGGGLLYQERLISIPVGLTVDGGGLTLLMPKGIERRPL